MTATTRPTKFSRGYKPVSQCVSAARRARSDAEHGERIRRLFKTTAPSYDCGQLGQMVGVQNQGGCGDCYCFSGTELVACAQLVAGIVSLSATPGFQLSVQCILDCQPQQGGCGGGDAWAVCEGIQQAGGCPSIAQYPGAGQNPGQCQSISGMTLYTFQGSPFFCTPSAGANSIANVQDVKNSLVSTGPVSTAIAARSGDWDTGPDATGVLNGPNVSDNSIDHQIIIRGYYDNTALPNGVAQSPSGGYYLAQNQWGIPWGANAGTSFVPQGCALIPYGAYGIGTEAFGVIAGTPSPTPPTPVPAPPPGPTPPPQQTLTIAIPGQQCIRDGLGQYSVPAQTVTVTLPTRGASKLLELLRLLAD